MADDKRKPVKVLHVTTVPETLGVLVGQAGYMKSRGFAISALSSEGDSLKRFAASENVPVYSVGMTRRITPLRDLLALLRLWQHLRRIRPHIVHAHTPKAGLLTMIAAWLVRVDVRVYHVHGLPLITVSGLKRTILRWTETISCRLSHRVLCVSRSVRDVIVAEQLCARGKIKVLASGSANGTDATERFNPKKVGKKDREQVRRTCGIPCEAQVVGFVGRIAREKGVLELAEAWKLLRGEFPSLHLLIVGQVESHDPPQPDVECLFRDDPRIHLVGFVTDTPPFYAAMDVLALPTYREGFGTVLLECAAMTIPAVATRIPGCVDAVCDEITGTLVPVRDAHSLSGAIRSYLQEPGRRWKHGQAARTRVLQDFRPERIWEELYQEYVRLLREKGLPLPQRRPVHEATDVESRAA